MQVSILAVATFFLDVTRSAFASSQAFPGIIYTKDSPGKWSRKISSHAPQISIDNRKVTITTPHPMLDQHYIVRHTLVLDNGHVIGEKTFFPSKDSKAISAFELPPGYKSKFYATSYCNQHDFWLTEGHAG